MAETTIVVARPVTDINKGAIPTSQIVVDSQITATTTTVNTASSTVLTDVNFIEYMRSLDIAFAGVRLRPFRQSYVYFDGVPISQFIQRPNVLELNFNNRDRLTCMVDGHRDTVKIGSSVANICLSDTDEVTGNVRYYLTEFTNPSVISAGATVESTTNVGYSAIVHSYKHNSGRLRTSANTSYVRLAVDAESTTDDYYSGNVLTIVAGTNAGESREIVSYNCATRVAQVSPGFSAAAANSVYSIGDPRSSWSSNTTPAFYTTSRGGLPGIFWVPDPSQNPTKFRTGERVLRIVDNPRNDILNATSSAEYLFVSNNLNVTRQQILQKTIFTDKTDSTNLYLLPTPTPTPTQSASLSPSRTPDPSVTPTISVTPSVTRTPASSVTPSISATPSVTSTVSPSITPSVTPSITQTRTPASSITPSVSLTASVSITPTPTITVSETPPITPSITPTTSPTPTHTPSTSASLTASVSLTPTISDTPPITPTPTRTVTPTISQTISVTPSVTVTVSPSLSTSITPSVSLTPTISDTPPITPTPSISVTPSITPSMSISLSDTPPITPTTTRTPTPTQSDTPPISVTPSTTKTVTPSVSRKNACDVWREQGSPNLDWISDYNFGWTSNFTIGGYYFEAISTDVSTFYIGGGSSPSDENPWGDPDTYRSVYSWDIYTGPPPRICGSVQTSVDYQQYRTNHEDPIAQTFYVSATENPNGIFISSVDLFFKNKGDTDVEVQLRPVVNGYPSSDTLIPGATKTLGFEDIRLSDLPNTQNSLTATRFTFNNPIYLSPAYEYALVVVTSDYGYDTYLSEKGAQAIGTNQIVSQQPHLGSLFKSQTGSTWTAIQAEDMMFTINRCEFANNSGHVIFNEDKTKIPVTNTVFDAVELHSDSIKLSGTEIIYQYKSTSNSDGSFDTSYQNIRAEERVDQIDRKVILSNNTAAKSFESKMKLYSIDSKVSPIVYHNRQSVVAIENRINDTSLSEERIKIVEGGSGYTTNASITFTSSVGYGANAWATANATTGEIETVIFDSYGSGYVDDVTATVNGDGTGAELQIITETGAAGGPAEVRYISKTITLTDGFDGGDLRLYLTAVKPPGSNVQVYYRVRNSLDSDSIDNKNWVRMVQKTSEFTYSTNREPIEYEFRPSLSANNIIYSTDATTYKSFNQFAVKVVLSSNGTTADKIPYVYDLRAIALPGDVY